MDANNAAAMKFDNHIMIINSEKQLHVIHLERQTGKSPRIKFDKKRENSNNAEKEIIIVSTFVVKIYLSHTLLHLSLFPADYK